MCMVARNVKGHSNGRVESCPTCEKYQREHPQPLSSTPTPDFPWQRVDSDLFEWQGENYLSIVDYFFQVD